MLAQPRLALADRRDRGLGRHVCALSGGTPALSSYPGSLSGRLIASVFGTIHSQNDEHRSSANSQTPKVRLASLERDFMTGTVSAASEGRTTGPVRPKDRAYFDQRFNSSFGERFSSFDERFAAMMESDRPRTLPAADFDERLYGYDGKRSPAHAAGG
jgi:hypothetical protein